MKTGDFNYQKRLNLQIFSNKFELRTYGRSFNWSFKTAKIVTQTQQTLNRTTENNCTFIFDKNLHSQKKTDTKPSGFLKL